MKLLERKAPVMPLNKGESFFHNTDKDAKEVVRASIASDMINLSGFYLDDNENVFALMTDDDNKRTYLALDSEGFNAAVYWVGLFKGVMLDEFDIERIIENIHYYVFVNDGSNGYIEDVPEIEVQF